MAVQELLLSVKDAMVRYEEVPIFENLDFNIHAGNRIALVGKNGAGKSTLMNIITGVKDLDDGERWEAPGLTIGYLKQDIKPTEGQSVFDFVFDQIRDQEDSAMYEYKVELVLEPLHLDPSAQMVSLSGGQLRRAALARALVEDPNILLLDEPTNHLDLEIIEWLENYLNSWRGTLVCISHDRTFLGNITNRIFWLDRGSLRVAPKGFDYFEEWSEMLLDQEERELKNRKQQVAQEVEWASRGVKARRKRNVRRVEQMREMRDQLKQDEIAYRRTVAQIKHKPSGDDMEHSSKIVAEFFNVGKSFETLDGQEIKIFDKFNLRIMRGERIGILGRNGSGKTTFLKLLTGELAPDMGKIKLAKTAQLSYFDQTRSDLKEDESLWRNLCPGGGDYVDLGGDKQRHVCGYLNDFLFDPSRARDKVSTLSGGQKNRLMLARVLANPGNFLILDEPTNDLDMDTLDMLEEILVNYEGTLFIVSHDRDFLDQTVTRILAFEGNGLVHSVHGGYSDYLDWKKKNKNIDSLETQTKVVEQQNDQPDLENKKPQKLSYKLQYELDNLPERIAVLEREIDILEVTLSDADLYQNDSDKFNAYTKRLPDAQKELEEAEMRWLELDEMRNSHVG